MGNEVKKRAWRGSWEISWEAITVAREAKTVTEARASALKTDLTEVRHWRGQVTWSCSVDARVEWNTARVSPGRPSPPGVLGTSVLWAAQYCLLHSKKLRLLLSCTEKQNKREIISRKMTALVLNSGFHGLNCFANYGQIQSPWLESLLFYLHFSTS